MLTNFIHPNFVVIFSEFSIYLHQKLLQVKPSIRAYHRATGVNELILASFMVKYLLEFEA